jgi:3D (Asp-Asp-Asp) domain-containing protein
MVTSRACGALLFFTALSLISAAYREEAASRSPIASDDTASDDTRDGGSSSSSTDEEAILSADASEAETEDADVTGNATGQDRRVLRVTAYCDVGITASGVPSGPGQCAAPADIPFGSRIYIPELETTFVVTDRTHKRFRHNTVDLFIPDEASCLRFGRQYLECVILPPEHDYTYASPKLAEVVSAAKERVRLPG